MDVAHSRSSLLALLSLSITIGYFIFRPFDRRRFLERCPLFLLTAFALFLGAIALLPEVLPNVFEWFLGHSIHEMVYEHQKSGVVFGELWTNQWWRRVGLVMDCGIFISVVWAAANLVRKHAARLNALALVLAFGWFCLIVWNTFSSVPF